MSDLKPWPLLGYAPGSYMCRCMTCTKQFEGDKRAFTCLECAVLEVKGHLIDKRMKLDLKPWTDKGFQTDL